MNEQPFGFYCICGAAFHGVVSPAVHVAELGQLFWSVHTGEGHASTDVFTARTARRRRKKAA